jgi:hypothetical protein
MRNWKNDLANILQCSSPYQPGDIYVCNCEWCRGEWYVIIANKYKWTWYGFGNESYDLEHDSLSDIKSLEKDKHKLSLLYREAK